MPPRHCRLLSYSCCAAPVACCTAACCAGPAALCCGCASDSISSTSAALCLARAAQRHPAFCSRFFSGVLPARQCALYGLPFRSLLLLTPPPLPSPPSTTVAGEVHSGDYCQSLERAELVREGTDVTIFCYSRMRYVVMQAVAQLEKEGYNPEVRPGSVAPICSLCTHRHFSWPTRFQQQACLV